MRLSKLTPVMLCALLLAVTASAGAQERDPDADSPSGQVYAIPLDSARGDAAPKRTRGSRGSGGGGSSSSAGSGSSAAGGDGVTSSGSATGGSAGGDDVSGGSGASGATAGSGGGSGSDGDGSDDAGAAGAGSGSGGDGGEETSAIRSENGFGSSSRVPGVDGAPTVSLRELSDPSGTRVYLLLLLGVMLAAGVGLASRTARRTH